MHGRLTVGDDQHHRLHVRVTAQVPSGQRQRVMQIRALLVHALQAGQLRGRQVRACRPKAMICNASERKRVLTRWLSASAVRFIGSQRFSITIENDVSTSSATAAWERVSVSRSRRRRP